jgi:hypothetical protein
VTSAQAETASRSLLDVVVREQRFFTGRIPRSIKWPLTMITIFFAVVESGVMGNSRHRFLWKLSPFHLFMFLLLLLSISGYAIAACNSPEARQFDFWIGKWEIQQKILNQDGSWLELPARNSVATALDGCALVEHWRGKVKFFWEGMNDVESMEGLSVRAYDPQSGKWRLHWMSSRTPRFGNAFEGNFHGGRGEFFSTRQGPRGKQLSRITFSNITKNSVHWDLAISNDDGKTWTTLWIMEMRRAGTMK